MLNKIILKGNIGREPEIKVTQEGQTFATFSLSTHLTWRDAAGEWQTHTDWHRIAVFRDASVKWIKDVLKKGDTVYVEGRLSYNSWKDRYHQTRLTSQVIVENWQGHIEHLRSSKSSSQEEPTELKGENCDQKDLDQENFQLMEESLSDLSPFPSSQRGSEEEKPFFQRYPWHPPHSQGNHSRVDHYSVTLPRVEHPQAAENHSKEDTL